jgi:hypothetical protein
MRIVIASLIAGCVLAGSAEAQQQVTFDELSPADIPILGTVVCAAKTGFRFYSDHFHLIGGTVLQDFTSNGTTHIGYESGRGFPITMERVGGGTFSLFSFDAAEFYSSPTDRPDAETLTITGHQQGGGLVTHTVAIDGIRDGAGGVVDFEHFVLPSTFVNLTSVVFTGLRAGDFSGGIAVDNLEYQLASPEVLAPCVATPLPPDTPSVTIISPAPGNVSGAVIVEATATDNVSVASVQFRINGVDLGVPDDTAPYAVAWDTTAVADGPYTITAEARDAVGNVATASLGVTVRNHTVVTESPHYLEFDGVDDYAVVADTAALSFGTGTADRPLTMEMWLRPDAMVRHQLVGKWDGTQAEYKLHIASGVIRLDLRDASAATTVSAFTGNLSALIGSWHHLAVTYDGRGGATAANGITLYVDGVAVALTRLNSATYVAMEDLTAPLQIGREGPSWKQYDGGLDEVRLWSVARTASELQATLGVELSGAEPGLVGYWRVNEGTGTTADDASPTDRAMTFFNGVTWAAGGPLGPAVPDETAPVIANLTTGNVTMSSVTVSFTTDEAATGAVAYTATGACPCPEVTSALGTVHTVTLSGLAADTVYQLTVRATDAAGNEQVTPGGSVRTLPVPVDGEAPTVTLTSPGPVTVSGTVLIQATATDNVGVTGVQFAVDGVALGGPDTTAPYTVAWDSTTAPYGPHTITAEARDAANHVTTATVVVTVGAVTTTPHYLEFDGVDDYAVVADAAAFLNLLFGQRPAKLGEFIIGQAEAHPYRSQLDNRG